MTLPLPSTEPAPTVRCRRCGRVCRNGTVHGFGPGCARREGLIPARRHRLASLCSEAADDTTLLDLIEGDAP